MKSAFFLEEAVRGAHAQTGVPGVAAAISIGGRASYAAEGVLALGGDERVRVDTPFRIASVSKSFTATLAAETVGLDSDIRAWLSHTAGLRPESHALLPEAAEGLWSYSNAGYWAVGEAVADAAALPFDAAMQTHVVEPLALAATGYAEPAGAARGHVQEGETGHRPVLLDAYARERWPSGGLWSTVADLVTYGRAHLEGYGELHEPVARALGARYALGWWERELEDGSIAIDHEGSVAGYQTLLLLVPERDLVLAVLTNSWRGSGLIRRVVEQIGLVPAEPEAAPAVDKSAAGSYALDDVEATVVVDDDALVVTVLEPDPVTGAALSTRTAARPLGDGVYGYARGRLMSHRLDFPRDGIARIGWLAMPRVDSADGRLGLKADRA